MTTPVVFESPSGPEAKGLHHSAAAGANAAVSADAAKTLQAVLSGEAGYERLLLRAGAGAGKSSVLQRLVAESLAHGEVRRVVVTAFTNKQTHPLARDLGRTLGRERVALLVGADRIAEIPPETSAAATVVSKVDHIPTDVTVVISPVHKLGAHSSQQFSGALGAGANGEAPFDVLFVDEAWQVANFLFDKVRSHAQIWVGVGDVGQLPPLEIGSNPWRGDPRYNPYRAWPTAYETGDARTWVKELPAVWRPPAGALGLWRAFYPDWAELHCIADPSDRWAEFDDMSPAARSIWTQVATGVPTLLEVEGLPAPDAPDVDLPLIRFVEGLVEELIVADVRLFFRELGPDGDPTGEISNEGLREAHRDPLVALLATRNQAVDDANDVVERLTEHQGLASNDLIASTIDSWQGQTNGFTVAVHPLSGATRLDEFNSAFGRLAVACTRATHGVLLVSRPGLDQLLTDAPARPGTAFAEPGFRTLPRQTHQRILGSLARGTINV